MEGIRHQVTMAQHHTLGFTRCTTGVEKSGEIILGDSYAQLCRIAFQQRIVLRSDVDNVLTDVGHTIGGTIGYQHFGARVL